MHVCMHMHVRVRLCVYPCMYECPSVFVTLAPTAIIPVPRVEWVGGGAWEVVQHTSSVLGSESQRGSWS